MVRNPFALVQPQPGHGEVHLSFLPPSSLAMKTLRYTYPLKLVLSSPHTAKLATAGGAEDEESMEIKVPLLFMLSYGGGLLPPDEMNLSIKLEAKTRLTLATQGSTKVFASPDPATRPVKVHDTKGPFVAKQTLKVDIGAGAALLLSPDPVQPFKGSNYSQLQVFEVRADSSLCFLDWVSSGRPARGEVWDAESWRGRNEVWRVQDGIASESGEGRRLLLRDAILLTGGPDGVGQGTLKRERKGVFGTLVLLGPLFERMGSFFVDEFADQPRHGAQNWDDEDESAADASSLQKWRRLRLKQELADDVVWTAARVRGMVLVKFSAAQVGGAKHWLNDMLTYEGTVLRDFGPGGLMSVR